MAFMAKAWEHVELYVGPSRIAGSKRLCAVVIVGESVGPSWKSNNPSYRVAAEWLPTTVWLRIWGAGKEDDIKHTWSYAGAEYAWPGKAPAPSRELRSPKRPHAVEAKPAHAVEEAQAVEAMPVQAVEEGMPPRGRRSGREVDE